MKQKLRFVSASLLLFAAMASYGQSYQPIPVTGFNEDVIANGTGAASASTTMSVDNSQSGGANFAFHSLDYLLTSTSTAVTYGLPVDGMLTSPNLSGLTFNLMPYTGSNSLRLPNQNSAGTLTFTTPVALSTLYLAASSGDGSSVISVQLNFADGTSQTVTNLPVTNWDSSAPTATPAIISNIGRVKRTTGVTSTGNFKLFQISVPVEAANQSKLINSITVTKTDSGTESKIPNIFAVSGKTVSSCPSLASVSSTITSATAASVSWVTESFGTGASSATYTVEVYTDAAFTTPVAGSPYTNVTETTQAITGLTAETTYYYRVKANNGTCESDYITGTFSTTYCVPTGFTTSSTYYLTNVVTTGGGINISNATGAGTAGYANFAATQAVSQIPGSSFNISLSVNQGTHYFFVWVDWNGDLDFSDAGETMVATSNYTSSYSGTITIPATQPLGNYRMRVANSFIGAISSGCGPATYGEFEDYTIAVAERPADCIAPAAPVATASEVTASGITITATAPETAPTGYIVVRSAAALTEAPVSGTVYAAGDAIGTGRVIAVGTTAPVVTDFVSANTHYYYTVFAYNQGGLVCFGPIFSEPTVVEATSCAVPTVNAGASNVGNFSADLNWTSVVGTGGTTTNYTVELYTDAELNNLAATYTTTTNLYTVTELNIGVTYYYRVKAETAGCANDAWTAVASFTTQSLYTPLTLTGYTQDVIANGTGIANISTTAAVDAVNNAYIALDYKNSATGSVTSVGLPVNRRLINSGVTGLEFLMADYSSNNSLRLPAQDLSGTLTLTQPVKASNLYVSLTSGSGGSTILPVINFTDGTSQTAAPQVLQDWYAAGTATQPALVSNIGRANRQNTVGNVETGASKVFYITLPIDEGNLSKSIASVTFTKTSAGVTEPVPHIFAISAQLVNECPVLNSAFTFAAETTANVTFGLLAGSAAATSYSYSLYTDEAMTIPVEGSPFTATTTSLALSNLTAETTYYYSAIAVNDICTSAPVTGSFTTNPTSGTDMFGKNGFVAYPNPAGAVLNIQAAESMSKVVLVNLLGQTILEQNTAGTQTQINLSSVAAGTYILQVTAGNKITTAKVVKQ